MIRGLKFFALALALVGSLQVCPAKRDPNKEYPLEIYVKNYETISEYLDRTVSSDDLRSNFAMAKEKLAKERSKLSMRRDRSLEKAIELFMTLDKELTDLKACREVFDVIEANEKVLITRANLAGDNYQLGRIDRIVEKVANNYLDFCRFVPRGELEVSFKLRFYDQINLLLLKEEPTNTDPEVNMAKVDELLRETAEGASGAEALRLLASLRTVSNDKVCTEEGFMVVLKNLVAARQSISVYDKRKEIDGAIRRIDRLVLHYVIIYTDNCYDLFPGQFKTLIKRIDSDTLKRLRLITSELYIGHHETTEVAEAQFQSEFTTPELVEHIKSKPRVTYLVGIVIPDHGDDLRRYIRDLAGLNDPDTRYLETFMDEVRGKNCVDLAKIAGLYDRYIVAPCQNYMDTTRKFFERFQYNVYRSTREKSQLLSDQVGLGLGLGVYHLCDASIRGREKKVYDLAHIARGSDKFALPINSNF